MPFIGDDIPMIAGVSEEVDSTVLGLEGGETSTIDEYAPLLLPVAEISEEPSGPDPKGKRKMSEGHREEDRKKKKKSKQPRHDKKKPKKAILNIDIDNEFAKGVEARSLEDLLDYVGKWVDNLFEGVARIDISTQSIFEKINNERKEAQKEKVQFEELHTADTAKIFEQEKKNFELEAQLAVLKEKQHSSDMKHDEEIIKVKRDAEKSIAQAKDEANRKVNSMRMSNLDKIKLNKEMQVALKEKYQKRRKEDIALLKENHKKEIEQAKINVVKEFTEDDDFVDYFRTIHQNTVDDILNTLKRLGDIPRDYDHGILFSQLPKPNDDM